MLAGNNDEWQKALDKVVPSCCVLKASVTNAMNTNSDTMCNKRMLWGYAFIVRHVCGRSGPPSPAPSMDSPRSKAMLADQHSLKSAYFDWTFLRLRFGHFIQTFAEAT